MIVDYLMAEQAIIERLQAQLTELRAVYAVADTATLTEAQQQTPNAQVFYHRDVVDSTPGGQRGQGRAQLVHQIFCVVLAVRNVRDVRGGTGARNEAGPILTRIIQALAGWKPSEHHDALRRVTPPIAVAYETGFRYYPLAFDATLVTV